MARDTLLRWSYSITSHFDHGEALSVSRSGCRARLTARGSGWTYAHAMATTDGTPGQPATTSRAESLSAHAEGSISEDAVLQGRRTVVDLEARAFSLDIQLIKALGGGYASA